MPIVTSPIPSSSPPSLPTPKRPQSILRGSSTESHHKKRPSSSAEPASQGSTSSKRQKVSFKQPPTVHVLRDEENEKSATLVAAEIRNALIKHCEGGGSQDYEELLQSFATPEYNERTQEVNEDAPSNDYLCKCFLGLASNSHLIKRNCASLVHTILAMKWLHRDDVFFSKFQRFLNQLVVSQSGFVGAVLKMLVENLAHLSTSSSGVRRSPGLTRKDLQERVQFCIRQILATVPSACNILCNILTNTFPYITDTRRAHTDYVKNLLQLSTSNPELLGHILDLILDRLMAIDLQIQEEISDIEEDDGETLIYQLAHDDPSAEDMSSESDSESSDSETHGDDAENLTDMKVDKRMKEVHLLVAKVDAILNQLFIYLHPLLTKSPPSTSQQTFNHLLAHLRNTLVRTPSSRHVQFLLFWAAQTSPDYGHQLLDTTLSIFNDLTRPVVIRLAAMSYTASFTARASSLSTEIVLYVTDTLTSFINRYRKMHETPQSRPDPRKHAPYYAAVQTCIYLFCFRWRDLIASVDPDDTDDDLLDAAFRQEIKWDSGFKDALGGAVSGRLNPLKVCSTGVLDEFADVAFRLGFCYVYSIVESNKRVRISQQGSVGVRETSLSNVYSERAQQLEGWFPFDPFCLPLSRSWIDPVYRQYVSPTGGREEGEEEGDSDEEMRSVKMESEDEEESDVATPEEG